MDNSLIHSRIEQLRKLKQIAKMDFYKAIDMTDSGYSKMISNNTMKITTLYKIAEVLHTDPQSLLFPDATNEWKEKYYQLLDMKVTVVAPEETKKTNDVAAAGSTHELTIAAEHEHSISKTKK